MPSRRRAPECGLRRPLRGPVVQIAAKAGSLDNLFAFDGGRRATCHLVLDPNTGQPTERADD